MINAERARLGVGGDRSWTDLVARFDDRLARVGVLDQLQRTGITGGDGGYQVSVHPVPCQEVFASRDTLIRWGVSEQRWI